MNRKQKQWEDKLNANKVGSQTNAEDFTKEFMQDMYAESSLTKHEETFKKETKQVILGNSEHISFHLLLNIYVLRGGR